MNKEQKAAVVDEVATQIQQAGAVFAVDYRGISVPQAAELRSRLNEAGARFRIVKNTLTVRAAERAGAEELKGLLEGPTAFAFVSAETGDVALAAKAIAGFGRQHALLAFKGGRMDGEPLSIEQLEALSRLPGRDVLHGQLVGTLAAPVTGLVRGLNQLIAGLAFQLGQIAERGLLGGAAAGETPEAERSDSEAAAKETPGAEDAAPEVSAEEPEAPEEASQATEQAAEAEEAATEAQESAGAEEGAEPSTEGASGQAGEGGEAEQEPENEEG